MMMTSLKLRRVAEEAEVSEVMPEVLEQAVWVARLVVAAVAAAI